MAARAFSISKSDSLIDQQLKRKATKLTPIVTSPSSANLAIAKSHFTKFESDSKKATSKSGDVNEQLMQDICRTICDQRYNIIE